MRRVEINSREKDSKVDSPDLSFGDVSLNGDELFSDEDEDDEDEDGRESQASAYSSPSGHTSPSEKMRLRNERRRRRSQLERDRRTAATHSQTQHEIHTLNNGSHSHRSRHSFSVSSSPQLSSHQHSRTSSASTSAAPLTSSADLPLHDAHIATLLLPLSTSLPLPTLHSRLSSLRSALHASHRQLTDYRSLLSDKQQQQADEKQINYDLFMRVKEQDEHIQWLTHQLKQANSVNGTPSTDGETERLTLRGMRGVALHAAHMQLREMLGEVDKRANEIRRLEEQVRTLKIEKEARSEGDSNEIERLRQEVAVLMGKLGVEADEREQRDRDRTRQERKLEKQSEKLKQQRQSLEHDLLQSTAEVDTLSSALSSLRTQHSTLTFDHQRLLDDKVKVEQEREGWRKRYEDVMDEVDTMRNEVRDAREVSDGIGRLVEGSDSLEVRRVRDECERKVGAMQEEVRAMERAVMDTKRGMEAELEARVQQHTAALHNELRQLREDGERQAEQWRADIAAARHEQEEAEVENEQLRQRLRQLTKQLEQATQLGTPRPTQPPEHTSGTENGDDKAGGGSVDPSLLAVLRAELDSVRAINQRFMAAQQQAENSARTQLDAAHRQLKDMEGGLLDAERREQQLRDELSGMQRQLVAQHQHRDDEQKQRQDEKQDALTDAIQQREQQWQYERAHMLPSLTALTAEGKEREAVVSKLMDSIAVLEDQAQRTSRAQEREKPVPSAAVAAAANGATLSTSVNGNATLRTPQRPSSVVQSRSAAHSSGRDESSPVIISLSASPAPATPVFTAPSALPVHLSPVAGELLSDSLLDQLASRLAAKLTHSESARQSTRPTPARATTSSSPVRAIRTPLAADSARKDASAHVTSSADIAAEMAAIYRQLEGKSRTFSNFAQYNTSNSSSSNGRTTARASSFGARDDRRARTAGRLDDADELKEAEQDDYIPLIRRIVGGRELRTQTVARRSPATTVQPILGHKSMAAKAARISTPSHVLSPTSSIISSVSSSPRHLLPRLTGPPASTGLSTHVTVLAVAIVVLVRGVIFHVITCCVGSQIDGCECAVRRECEAATAAACDQQSDERSGCALSDCFVP